MLPLHYLSMKPLLEPRTRLIALSSKGKFGQTEWDTDHMVERLDAFVGNCQNDAPHRLYDSLKGNGVSDVTLKDTFRQHCGINEKFYPNRPDFADIRKIADFGVRMHLSVSRGYERYLVEHFNRLDSEWLNRQDIIINDGK